MAQIDAVEIRQLVAHQTYARLQIERTWHRKHSADLSVLCNSSLHPKLMQQIEESLAGLCGRVRSADYRPEMKLPPAAHRGRDVAAANVKREHA